MTQTTEIPVGVSVAARIIETSSGAWGLTIRPRTLLATDLGWCRHSRLTQAIAGEGRILVLTPGTGANTFAIRWKQNKPHILLPVARQLSPHPAARARWWRVGDTLHVLLPEWVGPLPVGTRMRRGEGTSALAKLERMERDAEREARLAADEAARKAEAIRSREIPAPPPRKPQFGPPAPYVGICSIMPDPAAQARAVARSLWKVDSPPAGRQL